MVGSSEIDAWIILLPVSAVEFFFPADRLRIEPGNEISGGSPGAVRDSGSKGEHAELTGCEDNVMTIAGAQKGLGNDALTVAELSERPHLVGGLREGVAEPEFPGIRPNLVGGSQILDLAVRDAHLGVVGIPEGENRAVNVKTIVFSGLRGTRLGDQTVNEGDLGKNGGAPIVIRSVPG